MILLEVALKVGLYIGMQMLISLRIWSYSTTLLIKVILEILNYRVGAAKVLNYDCNFNMFFVVVGILKVKIWVQTS